MSYAQLVEPFVVSVEKEGVMYRARVVYVKEDNCCDNLFEVTILLPEAGEPFLLRERSTPEPGVEYMIWVDDTGKVNTLHQLIGEEIAKYLRDSLGVFLIDAGVPDREDPLDARK